MATERLSTRKTREILRQKWVLGLGYRDVASSADVSLGGMWLVVDRAKKAGLDWAAVEALDDAALEARGHTRDLESGLTRPIPDCARIDLERRRVGVTLELMRLEYVEQNPDGYSYSQFCEYYRGWLSRHRLSMRYVYVYDHPSLAGWARDFTLGHSLLPSAPRRRCACRGIRGSSPLPAQIDRAR